MINIKLNGEPMQIAENTTLQVLMQNLGIESKVMAAAVNMNIIKKEQWATYRLQSDDILELLEFVGGG